MEGSPAFRPLPLGYQAGPHADRPARRGWRVASLLLMLPALVVPVVPFACDAAPVGTAAAAPEAWLNGEGMDADDLARWCMSLPFFLAFPIVFWKCRLLMPWRPPVPAERLTLAVLGATGAAAVTGMIALLATSIGEWGGAIMLAVPGVTLLLAAATFARLAFSRAGPDARVSVALLGPYAANAAFCLVLWATYAQIGWCLTVGPAAAALAELCGAGVAALARRGSAS